MEDQGAGEQIGGVETGSMNRGERVEMRVAGKTITVLLVMILMMASMARSQPLPPVKMVQQQPAPEMSYRQAQRAVKTALQYAIAMYYSTAPVDQNSVRLTQGTLEFDAKGEHFTIPLMGLRKLTVQCVSIGGRIYGCFVDEEGNKGKYGEMFLQKYNVKMKKSALDFGPASIDDGGMCPHALNHDECMNSAAQFAAALNSLHIYALRPTTPEDDFHKQATAWLALTTKPAMPDAVRVRRLMAEDAIKNQKPEKALTYYEQALDEYSTWPEGWFNAALVAGELGLYSDATDYMQNYLELVPDAKDAQSARDQLEIWKIKAQEKH
jgi:tetratricopeptide (TPR) repeat protein